MLLQRIFSDSPFRCQKWLFKGKKRGLSELYLYDFNRIVWSDPMSPTNVPDNVPETGNNAIVFCLFLLVCLNNFCYQQCRETIFIPVRMAENSLPIHCQHSIVKPCRELDAKTLQSGNFVC